VAHIESIEPASIRDMSSINLDLEDQHDGLKFLESVPRRHPPHARGLNFNGPFWIAENWYQGRNFNDGELKIGKLGENENKFWLEIIQKYLSPIEPNSDKEVT